MINQRKPKHFLVISILVAMLILATPMLAGAESTANIDPGTQFYVPNPNHGAVEQIADLTSSGQKGDAALIKAMIQTPQAVWFTQGTAKSVQQDVKNTVKNAAGKKTVPVLVAYNIPFRDCSQFSAGGATSVAEYKAWIDGFAAGIGNEKAIVILEPDGLGIIPWYKPFRGTSAEATDYEWCQPGEADEATAADERFEMLNYAVETLTAQPNVKVYLDGTHSAWLNVSDAAHRLIQAGVADADGFFLNVSNYQFTSNSVQYGTWISSCIALWPDANTFVDCPNQYWNGGPLPSLVAQTVGEWQGMALDHFGQWSDTDTTVVSTPEGPRMPLNTSGINQRYANMLGSTQPATHFVIDTSRNGLGRWPGIAGHPASDGATQDWCNPPDRGLGLRPTADTGIALLDAYLWIKIPGESDGQCNRWDPPGSPDPVRGIVDPPAGQWFPEMALELVHNANPPLP